jgi:opacity protein-like surface antigen
MKVKLAILALLVAGSAQAVEVGLTAQRDYSQNPDKNGFGVTLGEKFGKTSVTGGFERYTQNSNDTNRYSLVAGYDVATVAGVTITPKVGVAFVDPTSTASGWQGSVGVGASYSLTKSVALTADYRYQSAIQSRVNNFDGNVVSAGLKVSF